MVATQVATNNLRPTIPESTPLELTNIIQSCWATELGNAFIIT